MDKTLIIGAGKAAKLLLSNTDIVKKFAIKGVVDDRVTQKEFLNDSYKILGTIVDIKKLIKKLKIQSIIIALPSERGETIRRILLLMRNIPSILIYIIPRLPEIIISNKITIDEIKKVEPVDLIGGKISLLSQTSIMDTIQGKTFMITGAGGFIGSELSRQIYLGSPKRLICIDRSEKNIFYLQYMISLIKLKSPVQVEYILGDITNESLIKKIFKDNKIHTIFHAAAYKHVPLLEENIYEAVQNNIYATYLVAKFAAINKVQRFILISTDKAVKPDSVMGITKHVSEQIMNYFDITSTSLFSSVRFGNVFNSSGSVIELFLKQINQDEPLTITNPLMKRYFMSVSEAVHLVLNAWTRVQKQTTYMFDMGNSVPILELAKCLLVICHKENNYPIHIIGNRKGEKINEQLWNEEIEIKIDNVYESIFALKRKNQINLKMWNYSFKKLISLLDREIIKNHSKQGSKQLIITLTKLLHV
jgi:FlaA1/EpsC-like NDP-sugar epimerase